MGTYDAGTFLTPRLGTEGAQQIPETELADVLQTMNTENFQYFLNQLGHTPPKYRIW